MNLTGTTAFATPSWDAAMDAVATYQINCGGYTTVWITDHLEDCGAITGSRSHVTHLQPSLPTLELTQTTIQCMPWLRIHWAVPTHTNTPSWRCILLINKIVRLNINGSRCVNNNFTFTQLVKSNLPNTWKDIHYFETEHNQMSTIDLQELSKHSKIEIDSCHFEPPLTTLIKIK